MRIKKKVIVAIMIVAITTAQLIAFTVLNNYKTKDLKIEMLEKQISSKDELLEKKDELIEKLNADYTDLYQRLEK